MLCYDNMSLTTCKPKPKPNPNPRGRRQLAAAEGIFGLQLIQAKADEKARVAKRKKKRVDQEAYNMADTTTCTYDYMPDTPEDTPWLRESDDEDNDEYYSEDYEADDDDGAEWYMIWPWDLWSNPIKKSKPVIKRTQTPFTRFPVLTLTLTLTLTLNLTLILTLTLTLTLTCRTKNA
jgi:hypothetical protein